MGCISAKQEIKGVSTTKKVISQSNPKNSNSIIFNFAENETQPTSCEGPCSEIISKLENINSEALKQMKSCKLLSLNYSLLMKIMNYVTSIGRSRHVLDSYKNNQNRSQVNYSQIKDLYEMATSSSLLYKYLRQQSKHYQETRKAVNNNTFACTRISNETKATSDYTFQKGNSMNPRTLLFTTSKLPDIKVLKNFNNIKDIADEEIGQTLILGRISKFKSFG